MDGLYDILISVFGDRSAMMLALMIFLAVAVLAFGLMAAGHARSSVKRRAAGIAEYSGDRELNEQNSLRTSSRKAVQRLLDYTTKHYSAADSGDAKILRRRLIQAGIFDPRAVAYFFVARTALAVGLSTAAFIVLPMFMTTSGSMFWLWVMAAGIIGYIGPSFYIDRRIGKNRNEHMSGFPDFMDLMVVCADSGLSMEAALERIGREMGDSYPSLCANIHMTNLEIRAGRTMTEALEHFGDRLGLEEARSFATLIQQSAELGSSITEALRVYSDDMRHKRLSRAEEKAYSLPAKLSLPMMICIFPTIFVVILLPVVVRLYTGNY
ncbi:MAG: type II secretion system F family protein [Xanthobacteraceae bacterium]